MFQVVQICLSNMAIFPRSDFHSRARLDGADRLDLGTSHFAKHRHSPKEIRNQ
jgi:hypothetical protein